MRSAWERPLRWLTGHVVAAVLAVCFAWVLLLGGGAAQVWRVRPWFVDLLLGATSLLVVLLCWVRWRRERAIREAPLPQFLKRKLRERYPHLTGKDCELVERGLRQFFLACLRSNRRFVAMPSQAADAMWHEFILHTRGYRAWCDLTLGRFLHHAPAEVLGPRADVNDGLRRAWFWACRDEAIDPRQPSRLPLLFALDAKLSIENGFRYVPDCRLGVAREGSGSSHCGTSFADSSYSGDGDALGGADPGGGADGADGGGDGCGGGCGGD